MPKLKNPFGKGLVDYLFGFYRCGIKRIVHRIVCSMSPKPPQGRRPTTVEKAEYAICFPKMKTWSVTGEPNGKYNCIAWSVGIEDQWIWPNKGTVKDFDAFYA
ncbi:hypothetical protein GF373_15060, partial [bacterium]|nr:hypothetical protein [bacterium]